MQPRSPIPKSPIAPTRETQMRSLFLTQLEELADGFISSELIGERVDASKPTLPLLDVYLFHPRNVLSNDIIA